MFQVTIVEAAPAKKARPRATAPAAAAPVPVPIPEPAPAPRPAIDPRWGLLGELAERDFTNQSLYTLGQTVPVTARWVVPNRELLLTQWGLTKSETRYVIDPESGEITRTHKSLFGNVKMKFQANALGEIVWADSGVTPFITKDTDGTYRVRWDAENKWALNAVTGPNPKISQLLTEGRLKPGNPALSMPVRAGDPALAAAAASSAAGKLQLAAAVPAGASIGMELNYQFLDVGDSASGTIGSGGLDCYLLATAPGQNISVRVNPTGALDPFLVIGTSTKCDAVRPLARNDDSGSLSSQLNFTAGGGTYIMQVSGTRKTVGDYEIIVSEAAAPGKRFGPGMMLARNVNPAFADGVSASTAPPSGEALPPAGTQIQDCPECPAMVVIKAGSFMMGSPASEKGHDANEGPRHMVTFAQPFAIGKYEVTFDEWDACVKAKGCSRVPGDQGWGRGRRPVLDVSWTDAMQYVRWLRRATGKAYYLPSEAEWEYAARAGTQTPWNTGKAIITDDANILAALGRTVPVGGYPANAFGVEGVHGNVQEWVADCYDVGYFGVPVNGGAMAAKRCAERVVRGGNLAADPFIARSARRGHTQPSAKYVGVGFRVARAL